MHSTTDPETLAERAAIVHATRQLERRLREVMKKCRMPARDDYRSNNA